MQGTLSQPTPAWAAVLNNQEVRTIYHAGELGLHSTVYAMVSVNKANRTWPLGGGSQGVSTPSILPTATARAEKHTEDVKNMDERNETTELKLNATMTLNDLRYP